MPPEMNTMRVDHHQGADDCRADQAGQKPGGQGVLHEFVVHGFRSFPFLVIVVQKHPVRHVAVGDQLHGAAALAVAAIAHLEHVAGDLRRLVEMQGAVDAGHGLDPGGQGRGRRG